MQRKFISSVVLFVRPFISVMSGLIFLLFQVFASLLFQYWYRHILDRYPVKVIILVLLEHYPVGGVIPHSAGCYWTIPLLTALYTLYLHFSLAQSRCTLSLVLMGVLFSSLLSATNLCCSSCGSKTLPQTHFIISPTLKNSNQCASSQTDMFTCILKVRFQSNTINRLFLPSCERTECLTEGRAQFLHTLTHSHTHREQQLIREYLVEKENQLK